MREAFSAAIAHIGSHGDTDVFPFPVENHVFRDRPGESRSVLELTHRDFDARISTEAPLAQSAMSPIGYTGFRWTTQLDPLWNAYLLALVIELGPSIEAARVGSDIVQSHRYVLDGPDSPLFERDGYLSFQEASRASAGSSDWIVAADIADFYPRVYHHRLENALREVAQGTDLPSRILRLLGFWSGNTSYGLPIGGPAARLLSELLLNRTDRLMLASGHRFHRYADDYRIFVGSKQEAHLALANLSGILLRNEGLALSKAKTRIMTRSEFMSTLDLDGEDPEIEAELDAAQRDRRRRARRLLGLSLRYDPYSPTAVDDYEALKDAVDQLDIEDLFLAELAKPRIDQRLTRRLLKALQSAEPSAKASVCSSLVQNLDKLAPLIPQVLQAIRKILIDVPGDVADETREMISSLLRDESHLFLLGVNRAFAIRVLADDPRGRYQHQFADRFDSEEPFIQRDIVLAMARWDATYWISDRKHQYDALHPWVKRAMVIGSYCLHDEGRHWRRAINSRLSAFDGLVRTWASERAQSDDWDVPL